MIWYSSDPHYGHKNIIKYCNRPFSSIEEMTEVMVGRWNERVSEDDTVYLLGDFAFCPAVKARLILQRLRGKIFLVAGNHDSKEIMDLVDSPETGQKGWIGVSALHEINDQGRKVVLCHYKMEVFNKSHRGAYQLFGHSHGSMPGNTQQIDVGVDCWDYGPVTLDECIERMKTLKPFRQADYHEG